MAILEENPNQSTPTKEYKKRGPKPKNKPESIQVTSQPEVIHIQPITEPIPQPSYDSELEKLRADKARLEQEVIQLKELVKTISVTTTKQLVNCSDDEINHLYIDYLSTKETQYDNAIIVEQNGMVIIPKSYYVISQDGVIG